MLIFGSILSNWLILEIQITLLKLGSALFPCILDLLVLQEVFIVLYLLAIFFSHDLDLASDHFDEVLLLDHVQGCFIVLLDVHLSGGEVVVGELSSLPVDQDQFGDDFHVGLSTLF